MNRRSGFYALAGDLFENAVRECQRIPVTAADETERAALASILFAMISTEAFINEVQLLSSMSDEDEPSSLGWAKTLSDLLDEAEKSRDIESTIPRGPLPSPSLARAN
jgi:hypothetical protein